jgi:hypothetical protein
MLFFDGVTKSCIKFKKTKVGFRCVKFQKGLDHPKCPPGKLKGGGRSQNYIRGEKQKPCNHVARRSSVRKNRRASR